MHRFLNTLVRTFRSTNAARTARRVPRRSALQVEGLEDRTVLSTASLVGSTLLVTADSGTFGISFPGHTIPPHIRQTTFQADAIQHGKLDVFDGGTLLGRFAIASVKNVEVSLGHLDAVNVNDSNGLPFAAGTTISLSASGVSDSLNLTGSRIISGGETYTAGNGARAGSLTMGGATYEFSSTVGSVTDTVKTTAPLVVKAFGQRVTQSGTNGVTQTLSGLSAGGAGDTLTYSNKNLVNLEMFSANGDATLNAKAAATGEKFFVVDLFIANEGVFVNATPSSVATNIVAAGQGDAVFVAANSGSLSINGSSSTFAMLGTGFGQVGVTSGIKANVFVEGVGRLAVTDPGNHTTQEHVTVTESTISGTGLFGNNAAVVHYSDVGSLQIATGQLADTYAIAGSKPGAHFASPIEIDDDSTAGMSVLVALDGGSGLDLNLNNAGLAKPAPASLFISASHATFNPSNPASGTGSETVTFAGGLTSDVVYAGFTSVTHS
jgi:hypothetical protein